METPKRVTLPGCIRGSTGVQDVSEEWSVERLSVAEAAEALGITRDAIHKRIRRGTIEHEKGEDGRFYVYVDTSTTGLDESVDESKDMSNDESKVEVLERLIEGQQDRIAFLEREMERRGDETARLHQIVAGLTQANTRLASRVPELEAPRESPQNGDIPDPSEKRTTTTGGGVAPEPTESPRSEDMQGSVGVRRRPLWRRVLGR